MTDNKASLEPELEKPQPLLASYGAVSVSAAAVIGLALAIGAGLVNASVTPSPNERTPSAPTDLSDRMVTPVDSSNTAAVKAAVAALRLPEAQRVIIERDVLERRRKLAWIVLADGMDPDEDIVAVEAGGLTQNIVLDQNWVPVAILDGDAPIRVTAVKDGKGGGVTVAFATRNSVIPLRVMWPGETFQVMP